MWEALRPCLYRKMCRSQARELERGVSLYSRVFKVCLLAKDPMCFLLRVCALVTRMGTEDPCASARAGLTRPTANAALPLSIECTRSGASRPRSDASPGDSRSPWGAAGRPQYKLGRLLASCERGSEMLILVKSPFELEFDALNALMLYIPLATRCSGVPSYGLYR